MADSLTSVIISAQDRTQAAFAAVAGGLGKLQSGFSSLNAVASSLGAALGVGVIAVWAKETIAAASALDDLADSTGSTVEELSSLYNQMRVSGVDMGTFTALTNKLAVGLAGVDDEGGKAGKALAALGVTAKDPATAMRQLATEMDKYADGANKAALMAAIFGRGASQYAGVMKDLARDTEAASTITTTFAAEAEKLQKELARARIETEALAVSIAGPLVSAFGQLLEMRRTAGAAGVFAWMGISADDQQNVRSELEKTDAKIRALKETIAALSSDSVAAKINRFLSPEDLAAANAQLAVMQARYEALLKVANAQYSNEGRTEKPDAPKVSADRVARVKKETDASRQIAAALREWKEQEDALSDAQSRHSKIMENLANGISTMQANFAAYIDKQLEAVRAYDEQTDAIGKTTEELNALELARQAEIRDMRLMAGWGQQAIDIYDQWAAAIGRRNAKLGDEEAKAAEKRFVDDWIRSAQQIGDGLTDALLNAAESGRDFFKSLARDLQRMFSQLVLRPIVQGVIGSVIGGVGFSGTANASGFGPNGSQFFGLANPYGSGFSWSNNTWGGNPNIITENGSSYYVGASYGDYASGALGGAGMGFVVGSLGSSFLGNGRNESSMSTGGAIGGAIGSIWGPVGALAGSAIGTAIGSFVSSGGGPKVGGYAASGSITPLDRATHFTPDAMDAALQPVVDSWVQGAAATIRALGGTSTAIGYDLGLDKDPSGTAANRLGIRATVGGRQVYNYFSGDSALGRDDATLQAAIELESKRALVAALAASDLPASIAAVFNAVAPESMSSGAVDNLMAFAAAMKSAIDAVSGSVLADAQRMWENSQRTSVQNLQAMGDEVIRLAGAMDGSTESMQALATASGQYRSAVVQVLLAIRQVAQQAEAMQGSLVQSIQTDGMDAFAAFNYWIEYANQEALKLGTATSPEQVGAISTNVYNAISTAFSTLPAEFRDAYKPALLGFLSEFGSGVGQALTDISGGVVGGTESPFAAVNTALDNAAAVFDRASPVIGGAASDMKLAAADMRAAAADFKAAFPLNVNVNLAGSEVNG